MKDEKRFIEAVENSDTATVEQMLYMDPGLVESKTESGISILQYAAYFKNVETIEHLMNYVSHLNIHEACALGYLNEVKRCIRESQKNLDLHSADGFTPLTLACYFDYYDIVEYLVETGADVDLIANNESKVAPLNSAVASGNTRIVELLLDAGADPDIAQQSGITPLHSAAHKGNADICEILIKNGAGIMIRSDDGRTAIDFATEMGHDKVVNILTNNID
jgi:ankyrin repeat protein